MTDILAHFEALMTVALESELARATQEVMRVESDAQRNGAFNGSRRVMQTHIVLSEAVARFATTIEEKWKEYLRPHFSTLSAADRDAYINAPLLTLDACAARMEGIARSRHRPDLQMPQHLPYIGDVAARERKRLENELKLLGMAPRPMDKLVSSSEQPEGWITPVEARYVAARHLGLDELAAGEELINRVGNGLIHAAALSVSFAPPPGTRAVNASTPLLIPPSYWRHRKIAGNFWAGSAVFDVPDPGTGTPREYEYFGIVLDPAGVYRQFPITHGMPPQLPTQEYGPVFVLREDGVIDLAPAEALDAAGNNVVLLRQLHPSLTSAARELVEALDAGNVPYAALRDRARAYLAAIDKPLAEIVFGQLYVEGVRLQNAATATAAEVARGELPPMAPALGEQLESVLTVNGTFVTNTADGASLLAAEERYRRRPEEERAYREAAVEFGEALLKHPEAIDPAAARLVRDAAQEMGAGNNPQRSGVVSETTVRNATITMVSVATILAAPPVLGVAVGATVGGVGGIAGATIGGAFGTVVAWPIYEALKQTKGGKAMTAALSKRLDSLTVEIVPGLFDKGKRLIGTQLAVVRELEPALRRLAKAAPSLAWLDKTLDWLAGR
jgi:hypothetical protein